jgi:preprotein translocase subunit SecG
MQVLNIFHVLITIAMIAAFGSGASGTVFGSRGAGNFLSRTTWVLATLFCLISLTMAVMASRASLTPETDLGVVATAPATEQLVPDMPMEVKAAETSDMPSIESVTALPATQDNAGDLPVIEETVPASDTTGDSLKDETSGADGT